MRSPGQPASGRSRFGVSLAPATRTFADLRCGDCALAVFRLADAMRCCSTCGRRRLRFRSSSPLFGGLDACDFKPSVRLTIAGAGDSRQTRCKRAHRRSVTSSATASFVRHSKSVMHRRTSLAAAFRYAFRAFAAWPGEWSFPLARPAALMGFMPFAGLAPKTGGRSFLIRPGPPAF